jgi:hypothetical protein
MPAVPHANCRRLTFAGIIASLVRPHAHTPAVPHTKTASSHCAIPPGSVTSENEHTGLHLSGDLGV